MVTSLYKPEFIEGEIVVINPHVEAKPGDYVIVKNDEEETTFKQRRNMYSDLTRYSSLLTLHGL